MHDARLGARGAGDRAIDVVPAQRLLRGDVEAVADHLRIAEQRHEALGEVGVVGQRPQRAAVAVHDHLAALAHPLDHGPAALERQGCVIVGVARPHDGDRKALVAIGPDEQVLASDLVPRILPIRIAQRGRFQDRNPQRRLLIRGRGTDEDVLTRSAGEEFDAGVGLIGGETQEVHHHVPAGGIEHPGDLGAIVDVGPEHARPGRDGPKGRGPTIQHRHLDTACDGQLGAGRTDDPGPSDEQRSHRQSLPVRPRPTV